MIGANIQEDNSKLTKTNSPHLQLDLNKIRQKELVNYLLNYMFFNLNNQKKYLFNN